VKPQGVGVALSTGVLVALVTGTSMGSVGANVMPMLLAGFRSSLNLSNTAAGLVAAGQLLATAVVTLTLAPRAAALDRVRLARIGLTIAALGFASTLLTSGIVLFTVANVVAGAGIGAVFAATAAGLATMEDVDRATVAAVLGSTVVIAALVIVVPMANAHWIAGAGFLIVATCCLTATLLVGRLPEAQDAVPVNDTEGGQPGPGLPILGAVALLAASDQGAWSYAGVLGENHAHLSAATVSVVLSVAGIASLVGVGASTVAVPRLGRWHALAWFMGAEAIAKLLVAGTSVGAVYAAATITWQVCYLGVLVMLLAAAAKVDPGGRWIAAFPGAMAIGAGLGPAVTGIILDTSGALALSVFLASATLLAAIPLLRMIRGISPDPTANRKWALESPPLP
jgi:predicted MFS family arabinose efflux permease